jgi:hypothetical protein
MKHITGIQMIYDLFYVSRSKVDNERWQTFKSRFPAAQCIEHVKTYTEIKQKAFTKMFWVVWDDLIVTDDFDFSHRATQYDNMYVHVFKNGNNYDGISLFPKSLSITEREFSKRFYVKKKEIDVLASEPVYVEYDIVFISYNEPNAETNYNALQQRFPRAKRVHGVKGIHQAHIAAAQLCDTDMFWVVDADAVIVDDFNFDYHVLAWDNDAVHVWRSRNPINDLEYGYGGVKLLPTKLTLNMKTDTTDMTTSISSRFKAIESVSNITMFNTDEFSAWKSAFRECVKLSSKTIRGQVDEETEERLQVWTTVGLERRFGDSAVRGARSGMAFGSANRDNPSELARINDFEWLRKEFDNDIRQ